VEPDVKVINTFTVVIYCEALEVVASALVQDNM